MHDYSQIIIDKALLTQHVLSQWTFDLLMVEMKKYTRIRQSFF